MNIITNSTPLIHPVARQYFDKVAVLGGDVYAKAEVNAFVTQLSRVVDPNLWVCWPLRSLQSIGSGTIAPSLGLLGNFPGTLTNGPTWGENGITLTLNSSQSITTSIPIRFPVSMFFVKSENISGSGSGVSVLCGDSNASGNGSIAISGILSTNFRSLLGGSLGITFNTNTTAYQTFYSNGSQIFYLNGTVSATATGTGAFSGNPLTIIAAGPTLTGPTGSIRASFTCFFMTQPPRQDILYNIYKSTIGQGLGLP